VDGVFDPVGDSVLRDSLRIVRTGGRVCQLGFLSGLEPVAGFVRSVSLRGSPGKTAPAAAGFRTGPLLENPYRAGHLLRDEYAGQYSARRGPDWRFRYPDR
jgi:NADPH:quinone reductase-like Zn-dependent oxidoreductase